MTAPALTQYIQGVTAVSADGLNTFAQTCDTASQLQAFVGTQGMQVFLRGLSAINDGGQGAFYWNANSSANDGVNNIQPFGAAAGTWTRITSVTPSLIYCTATGSNVITLTPDTPVGEYENGQMFGFVAAADSTGSITLGVGSLSALPVYLPTGVQAGANVFESGTFYIVAYVPSYNSNNGGWAIVSALPATVYSAAPQVTVYTSGSGTYDTPTNSLTGELALYLEVEMAGGGGGGAGSGTSGEGNGGNGTSSTFGALTANYGSGGSTSGAGGAGGTATGGDVNITGAMGSPVPTTSANISSGGDGGSSPIFGGGGAAGVPDGGVGGAAAANTGGGGGGAGGASTVSTGGGGGSGGVLTKVIAAPSATYAYAVGAGGAAGIAGASGVAGGAGAAGIIKVTAYFQ